MQSPQVVKVAVCIPSSYMWHADFSLSLLNLVMHVARNPLKDGRRVVLSILNERGSILPQIRQNLVEGAIKVDVDYVLFIDSDMMFPADLLHLLMDAEKNVVACNCPTKSLPSNSTARVYSPEGMKSVYTEFDSTGILEVDRIGTGVMLVKTSVFKKLQRPFFRVGWDSGRKEFIGEDWEFCRVLKASGEKLYIQQDASKLIGHIGSFMFTHDEVMVDESVKFNS